MGPRPDGLECRHLDGNPANNRLLNLKWGTRTENVHDSMLHGTKPIGELHSCAILRAADIPVIRLRCRTESCAIVAASYGVSKGAIQAIRDGITWKSIPKEIAA